MQRQNYLKWKNLFVTTCDEEIKKFCSDKKIPVVMTSKKHKRCLDRVYEAASKMKGIRNNDIVICVQGDEPMMQTSMINNVLKPIYKNKKISSTVLAMDIIDESQFRDRNAVKIIHKLSGDVLYTSRAQFLTQKIFQKLKRKNLQYLFRWHSLKVSSN